MHTKNNVIPFFKIFFLLITQYFWCKYSILKNKFTTLFGHNSKQAYYLNYIRVTYIIMTLFPINYIYIYYNV